MDLWDILQRIWDILRQLIWAWLGPPDYNDETKFREWLDDALAVMHRLIERTRTDLDDKYVQPSVEKLQEIVADDRDWAIFYAFICLMLESGRLKIGVEPSGLEADGDVKATADKMGIPIGLLIQLIMLLLKLLRRN